MVLITSLGDQILTGGKLIRCTVDRNITCLQGEERREKKGGWLSKKKKRERRTMTGRVREEKSKAVHDQRQRK